MLRWALETATAAITHLLMRHKVTTLLLLNPNPIGPWSLQIGRVGNRGLGSKSQGRVCSVHRTEDSGFLLSANGWYLKKLRVCLCPLQNFGLKLQPVVTVLRLEAFGGFLTPTKGPGRRASSLCGLSLPCDITSPPSWRMQPLGAVLDAELPSPGIKLPGFPSGKKRILSFINCPASVLLLYQHHMDQARLK